MAIYNIPFCLLHSHKYKNPLIYLAVVHILYGRTSKFLLRSIIQQGHENHIRKYIGAIYIKISIFGFGLSAVRCISS